MMSLAATAVQAQIVIGGNVYGGGNEGKTGGSSTVIVRAGDIDKVFGGARMADVEGSAFVQIDGANASDYIVINYVYGGNDISGSIGTSTSLPPTLPAADATTDGVDATWNAFIHISTKTTTTVKDEEEVVEEAEDAKKIYIGQLFAGGNGDYPFTDVKENGKYDLTIGSTTYTDLTKPDLERTYLNIHGGSIVYAYGGGNKATVTDKTVISVDNPSKVVNSIEDADRGELLTEDRFQKQMGINTGFSYPSSDAFQIGRLFGGNNQAAMAIRPTWKLVRGKVRNLYSGGNRGDMTHPNGIFLRIDAPQLVVDNVYGGCRMADVIPSVNPIPAETIEGIYVPGGYAARVSVLSGDINNVYGGNDITGRVHGGNAVGIHCSIRGDVYGGGNGAYPYTDNPVLEGDDIYGDLYYPVAEGENSVEVLNDFRPNAESVSVRLVGDEDNPTIIGGAVYCGGNCATLHNDDPNTDAKAELKIGSYVKADKVFLGNNGEMMVDEDILKRYADEDFSTLKLTSETKTDGKTTFDRYMEGVDMDIMPSVVFDGEDGTTNTYEPYSTYFGSIFCGGNRGSMTVDGKIEIQFNKAIIVFDKVVGGSNDANVSASEYNVAHEGGLTGDPDEAGDKLHLTFAGLRIQPKRWKNAEKKELIWNTISASTGDNVQPVETGPFTPSDLDRRFKGGNVYGGCYNSGHVNGNVVIDIDSTLVDRTGKRAIFDQVEENEGEAILYGHDSYTIKERHSGVILDQQGMDVLGQALNVFGGGYGEDSEIWGSTTINLKAGYTFQIFGGGEKGAIGKKNSKGDYSYDAKYSTTINLKGGIAGVKRGDAKDDPKMAEAEFIYGGGFEGPICGNTQINLDNGRIFNSFAGSCNADILGHTETYIGVDGFPWIRDHVYGGNDLGGKIRGTADMKGKVREAIQTSVYNDECLKASAYMEYIQGRVDYIFGGCYGNYDYSDRHYAAYTNEDGTAKGNFTKPRMTNAFVHFKPTYNSNNMVNRIYGAGQGYSMDSDRDIMQDRSYVLIDVPDEGDNANNATSFTNTMVFGAGDFSGVGMGVAKATAAASDVEATAVVDLFRGRMSDVFGASCNEGITRRTMVRVPASSTIHLNRIFGGGYGLTNEKPCDVYEAHVSWNSDDALVGGYRSGIFGGNNNCRRTLYSFVDINSPVYYDKTNGYLASAFGAGYGEDTWSQYTQVNLNDGAQLYEVYGGGYGGMVLNKESVEAEAFGKPIILGNDYTEDYLDNSLVETNALGGKCNANVLINTGANVSGYLYNGSISGGYAYAGGLGASATVSGSTFIGLYGGLVFKDVYAGGTSGAVMDLFKVGTDKFVATTNAYIVGGTCRNVYGGGWEGNVGYTKMETGDDGKTTVTENIPGETHVVIGIRKDQTDANLLTSLKAVLPSDTTTAKAYSYYYGIPAIQRNAYGGGEGGAVFGTTNLTLNNAYIGYVHLKDNEVQDEEGKIVQTTTGKGERYEPKLNDETWKNEAGDYIGDNRLVGCGNVFGGGYDDNSSVDTTNVEVWGGMIRNSVFGGGEIATIGRGATEESGNANSERTLKAIYQAGQTNVTIYNAKILHNVFGGGKGYNELGYGRKNQYYTDGYVFGQTRVNIYGGEVGTADGVEASKGGYGNVFGGGDIGYVYSPGHASDEGTGSPGHYYYYDAHGNLTEDCRVVVSPRLQVKPGKTASYGGHTYEAYEYVPTEYLNTLKAKKEESRWADLFTGDGSEGDEEERGVHIYNAVFAGGNVSSNSDQAYANATTVFGNTTATLYDVYHQDFITVGTEHTGGLYGGGNLSVVGGYRELNITNYGTDYYGMNEQITLEEYDALTNRERAYFQLQYLCQYTHTVGSETYTKGQTKISEEEYKDKDPKYKGYVCTESYGGYTAGTSTLTAAEYAALSEEDKEHWTLYWERFGFCSIYAGRLLNTIQRADFCGVYGSRLVLQGAVDRVADIGDKTVYTINRVGELSLNKQKSVIDADKTLKAGYINDEDYEEPEKAVHGNYFGIYSVVNYLGSLTSDVNFMDTRKIYQDNKPQFTDETYYKWKVDELTKPDRNWGYSENQVALASGVFLELTTENSTASKKDYGLITGIVELALINVKKDIEGGGYVYAKNEHGTRKEVSHENKLLSEYNKETTDGSRDDARTNKFYEYRQVEEETDYRQELQTSGNFINRNPLKRIVDDCYPNNGIYKDGYVKSPAHYWYIKGTVYVYDQEVSAYAGSTTAYHKEAKIPLTITAASQGKLKLLNVQPNLYAYYSNVPETGDPTKIGADGVKVNDGSETYYLNDVISWWDWNMLSDNDQKYFVKETITNVDTCTIDGTVYPKGTYAMLPSDSVAFKGEGHTVYDKRGKLITKFSDMFRLSNNIGHNTGYVLTFDMDSPKVWDDYYTKETNANDKKSKAEYNNESGYIEGPTFKLKVGESGLFGQRKYDVDEIVRGDVWTDYQTVKTHLTASSPKQADVQPAYVALEDYGETKKGNAISEEVYNGLKEEDKSNFKPAKLCISTIQLGENEYVLNGELVSATEDNIASLAHDYKVYNNSQINKDKLTDDQARQYVNSCLLDAYICTEEGMYGGKYFQKGTNYSALQSWCALPGERNENFEFNYDAFDVLVDSVYQGNTALYHAPYSNTESVDYVAHFTGTDADLTSIGVTPDADGNITREQFEALPNDQVHYTRLEMKAGQEYVYIAKEDFIETGEPFAKGQEITQKDYNTITNTETKSKIKEIDVSTLTTGGSSVKKFFRYEDADGNFNDSPNLTTDFIDEDAFEALSNNQKYFSIQGMEPTERTTLYVSRESTAKDVTKEKIISVVYQYTYYEGDAEGDGVSRVSELHVVNIHLKLESGVPEVGTLYAPATVLPGNNVQLTAPPVNPGLYEPISNGWEIYTNKIDADNNRNGAPFTNKETPLYWYQNQNVWVAFYTRTYLGKTYSNAVPLSVANYHDLGEVLADKEHHLYVDHPDVMRNSKIYINDADNGLDQLSNFYDLSTLTTEATAADDPLLGHALLNTHVKGCNDLDIILRTNLNFDTNIGQHSWTSIGSEGACFAGTLHGDGYTISGLDNSLFDHLCGNVYNLGVTGSFTSAGIANTGDGYIENCWINTTANILSGTSTKAVFNNPTDGSRKQVVNCYYPASKRYAAGDAHAASDQDFYNGTVAYNLNGFYLNKRYYDKATWTGTKDDGYRYLTSKDDEAYSTGYYPATTNSIYKPENGSFYYVESRYGAVADEKGNYDNDFIYAEGKIPESKNDRMRTVTEGDASVNRYAPIYPDDYIFFGQSLTYGYNGEHSGQPAHVTASNRVYRAPAYYQSKEIGVAHFNPDATLAATSSDGKTKAYPNMTAIDFKGHDDYSWHIGTNDAGLFYPPLLDDRGLESIINRNETHNLLVYAPSSTENAKSYTALTSYFTEPAFSDSYIEGDYRRVAKAPTGQVAGHLVTSDKTTLNDHLLVDKEDFNCPISYTMGAGKRMWYQRVADNYVDTENGWETVSLPFTAELVTTHQKGEITHFYSGSEKLDDKTMIGHEYWLREYKDKKADDGETVVAIFDYPDAISGNSKTRTNTFLWDYYYSANTQKDARDDTYQTYYKDSRTLNGYPLLAADKPYIVGFPGTTYREFDLSGRFIPQHTAATTPAQLEAQTITFASDATKTTTISVSDNVTGVSKGGYVFKPNYMTKAETGYLMNGSGNAFKLTSSATALVPFRPYFVAAASGAPKRAAAQTIVFDTADSSFAIGDEDPSEGKTAGELTFSVKPRKLVTTSSLHEAADVHIYSVSGQAVASFTIQPGETIETDIPVAGVYILRAANGRYVKKIAVK